MTMIISNVKKDSIADELGLKPGDMILSINDMQPKDVIDLSFYVQDEEIVLHVKKTDGEEEIFEIEKDEYEDLGIDFECAVFDGIKSCLNKCIFCFVDQQPKGLRDSLYVKDDDWRLSYLQGTYITATNFKEEDWQRLEMLRLSPLYISIHTTNPDLRIQMLKNKNAGKILDVLERFQKLEIELHGQIVLCPGFNDGAELKRTLDDLKKYKKTLKSLAIVPVGISKYRTDGVLKPVTADIARETIELANNFNTDVKKNIAMVSDEIFIVAGIEIPDKKYYGKFVQIEDGVGAIRLLEDDFKKHLPKLKKALNKPVKLTLATGLTAANIFRKFERQINIENFEFEILDVKNEFFGDEINVAGLIVGKDILKVLENKELQNLIIPSVMLKEGSTSFLDDITVEDIQKQHKNAHIHILKDCYSFKEIAKIINTL